MSEVLIPKTSMGRDMSPIEVRTGVVLPIWSPGEGRTNRHHAHFYKEHFEKGPLAQRALLRAVRFTRLQRVRKGPHRDYHDIFDGTADPANLRMAFTTTVLNEAGYIPPFVIDMTSKSPVIKETTPVMRATFREEGTFKTESRQSRRREIGQFLMQYAHWQKFDHVKKTYIYEFIDLTPEKVMDDPKLQDRRDWLGMKLTNIAIGMAVDPFEKRFQQARDAKALRPDAPVCAFQEVKLYVGGHEPQYFDELRRSLQVQYAAA